MRISFAGAGGLLLDVADGAFDDRLQRRIWALSAALAGRAGIDECVPGMNNLLVTFDPLRLAPEVVERMLREGWDSADDSEREGRVVEVPVSYGGDAGPDLVAHAAHCGLTVAALVARHTKPLYSVAAVGAMPGFVYLSGLDPALARPRRAVPAARVPKGSVIIGGAQAGIMPVTAPSGWHILGHTALELFDPARSRPALFSPGDRIRFVAAEVRP